MPLDYNPKSPDVIADPFPILRRLQAEEPVHWSPVLRSWVFTRYADVKASLNDHRLSADRITPFLQHERRDGMAALQELTRAVGLWALFTDPPKHTRLRGLMTKVVTPRSIERLRPRIQEIVDGLLDRVCGDGRVDLIRDVANPLPVAVIGDLIGVPREDGPRLKAWSDDLAAFIGSAVASPDKYARAGQSVQQMNEYFGRLLSLRRTEPRDDIVSGLLAANEADEKLTDDEVVATCVLLLFAGHETTTNLIGNAVIALLRNRDQCEAWRKDPSLTSSAVEELIRYDGPGQGLVRVATAGFEVNGRTIERGSRVFLMINAANRDPREFTEPDRLRLARRDNHHITFGYGVHFCLGAPLARLEAQLALPTVLRRLQDLEFVTDRLEWTDSLIFRGVKSLPLSFRV
jgi:cytochrome P450